MKQEKKIYALWFSTVRTARYPTAAQRFLRRPHVHLKLVLKHRSLATTRAEPRFSIPLSWDCTNVLREEISLHLYIAPFRRQFFRVFFKHEGKHPHVFAAGVASQYIFEVSLSRCAQHC